MNPYQTQLYAALWPFAAATSGGIKDALQAQKNAQQGSVIFHLHWEHQVLIDPDLSVETFLDDLAALHDAGGKIIWTLHNLVPHDVYPAQELADLIQGLALLADVIQVHSLEAVAAVQGAMNLTPHKIRVIPHGNYHESYHEQTRATARAALGLQDARMVVLLPGRIAQYKNPEGLVDAFIQAGRSEDRLILAGHFVNGMLLETKDDARIILQKGFASAENLAIFHAAANLVVLPYVQSLTSGSAILAATLGRGVLGPSTPGLRDAVASGTTGVLYDPKPENSLLKALAAALNEGPELWDQRGKAAAHAAAARDMRLVSASWEDLITGILRKDGHTDLEVAQ